MLPNRVWAQPQELRHSSGASDRLQDHLPVLGRGQALLQVAEGERDPFERGAAMTALAWIGAAMIGLPVMSRDGPVYAAGPMRGHWPSWLPDVFSDLRSPNGI